MVDIQFVVKSAVDSKYCLLVVDLITSKIYTHQMKKVFWLKKLLCFMRKCIKKRRWKKNEDTDRKRTRTELDKKSQHKI